DFVGARHGVGYAIEEVDIAAILDADLRDAGPVTAFQKTRHGAVDQVRAFSAAFFNEIGEWPADNLLERQTDKIGKAAVDGADFAFESERDEQIVERIDQVAIALLGTGDDLKKLVHLLVTGRSNIALLDAADQAAKLGHFAAALPGVGDKKDHENDQAHREGLRVLRDRANGGPRQPCKDGGDDNKQEGSGARKLGLALFELLETRADTTAVLARRWTSGRTTSALLLVGHEERRRKGE